MKFEDQEKRQVLLDRVHRLEYFAKAFDGRQNYLVRTSAYYVLEVYQSRPAAIWSYIKWAIRESYRQIKWDIKWYGRLYWLKYGRRMSEEQITEFFESNDELADSELIRMLQKLAAEEKARQNELTQ